MSFRVNKKYYRINWLKYLQGVLHKMLSPRLVVGAFGMLLPSSLLWAGTAADGYVMHVQMTPAICVLDGGKVKKRKCLEGYSLNIQGLYPQTSQQSCQTSSSAVLSPLQAKVVARVMPDEQARFQLWRTVGGCVDMNASQYFRTIINYADRLKVPLEISSPKTQQLEKQVLQNSFLKLNPSIAKAIHFRCQAQRDRVYLTEVQVCYTNQGAYTSCPRSVQSNCPSSYYIKGSY